MQRFLYRLVRMRFAIGLLLFGLSVLARAGQPTILIVGDSISAAYGMSLEQGWVALLEEQLADSHPDYSVVNASISGETTAGGLRRLPALLTEYNPSVVVIELGGNDGLRGFPIRNFRDNLQAMAEMARATDAEVLLLTMEIPPNYGSRYTASFRESYQLVAEATGSVLGPFMLEDVATDTTLMQTDGIHPTVEAQPIILDTVFPALADLLSP
jgi:acyl-CoA thioesterase-1